MASPNSSPREPQPRRSGSPSGQGRSLNLAPTPRAHDFIDFVKNRSHAKMGYNGLKEHVPFIPREALVDYWTTHGIDTSQCPGIYHVNAIQGYEIIFSILAYIDATGLITFFIKEGWDDAKLPMKDGYPFSRKPVQSIAVTIEQFRKHQWQFSPVLFPKKPQLDLKDLDPRQILPIESFEVLYDCPRSNTRTKVLKVKFHQGYSDLSPDNIVVFKEYQVRDNEMHRTSWKHEVGSFLAFGSDENIVKYLGSFEQEDTCVTILEYANGGSLQHLFDRQHKPQTLDEVQNFWRALLQLSQGIRHVQITDLWVKEKDPISYVHRDIKPGNILVFSDSLDNFSDTFSLKLADFNTSSGQDNDGNGTYRPPEAFGVLDFEGRDWKATSLNGDIWSLGCACSEALVWLAQGTRGLKTYKDLRKGTLAKSHQFPNSGYDACFHDGERVLSCVYETHEQAVHCLASFDTFSPQIRHLIEEYMLQPHWIRASAAQVWDRFDEMLWGPNTPRPPPSPENDNILLDGFSGDTSSDVPSPAPHLGHPASSRSSSPTETSSSQNRSRPRPGRRKTSASSRQSLSNTHQRFPHVNIDRVLELQGMGAQREFLEGFSEFKAAIGERHFVFVIDTSVTMVEHWERVVKTIKAATWLLKDSEKEYIEVRFSSDSSKRYTQAKSLLGHLIQTKGLKKVKDIAKLVEERLKEDTSHVCNMKACLNDIFNKELVKADQPTSVFVLTDGAWGDRTRSSGGNVERSIASLERKTIALGMARAHFCVQFVRFGTSNVGKGWFRYLDGMLKDNDVWYDFVDHKSHLNSIWSILMGALGDEADDEDAGSDEADNDEEIKHIDSSFPREGTTRGWENRVRKHFETQMNGFAQPDLNVAARMEPSLYIQPDRPVHIIPLKGRSAAGSGKTPELTYTHHYPAEYVPPDPEDLDKDGPGDFWVPGRQFSPAPSVHSHSTEEDGDCSDGGSIVVSKPGHHSKESTSFEYSLNFEEPVGSLWKLWVDVLWYTSIWALHPPPKNAKRVTYTCGCGDRRYLDVVSPSLQDAASLQDEIRRASLAIRQRASTDSTQPSPPPQAHFATQSQSQIQASASQNHIPLSSIPSTQRVDNANDSTQGQCPSNEYGAPKFLMICVNNKRGLAKYQHIDISSITNDQFLFQEIFKEYSNLRCGHEFHIRQLIPWLWQTPRHISAPVSYLYRKLRDFLQIDTQNLHIFIPKTAEFVRFQLMTAKKEVVAGNFLKPDLPGRIEVVEKKTYEYRPFPSVKILEIPLIHELQKPGEHLGCFWWKRFPKKLDEILSWDEDLDCIGWGIYINEGWNIRLVGYIVFLSMAFFALFVIVYSAISRDGSTGASIGSFLIAFVTLGCWLRYEGWKTEAEQA